MENKNETVVKEETKKVNKKNKNNKEEDTGLTYSLSDQLDKLFPQYKPSKKKEENN